MRSRGLAAVVACGWALSVQADAITKPVGGDGRLREVIYDAAQVIRLDGQSGYHIALELEPGERFVSVAAGDSTSIDVGAEGRYVMLKPKVARLATNLTLITDRRTYHFDYHVGVTRGISPVPLYGLKFVYPPDPAAAPAIDPRRVGPPRPRNTAYFACGAKAIRPIAAWDDGLQLHLKFAGQAEWPAVYAQAVDGSESLVNFHVEQDELVVHRLARRFVLRRGGLTACVENRGALPDQRASTGTVSESVERQSPEVDR